MRESKIVRGFRWNFAKMFLPGTTVSYGPHAMQASEGTTLGVYVQFNADPTLKQIIKDQGYLFVMSEAKILVLL